MQVDILITNIGELLLMDRNGPVKGSDMSELPVKNDMAIGINGNTVVWIGSNKDATNLEASHTIDAKGRLVTPGLVEAHTHLVFGGSREKELALKQKGVAYLEILKQGGGILSTVRATQAATFEELLEKALFHLDRMAMYGITTVEAKSGYGLDKETELNSYV